MNYHQPQQSQSRRHPSSQQQQYTNRPRTNTNYTNNDPQNQHHYIPNPSQTQSSRNTSTTSSSHTRSIHAHSHQNLHNSSRLPPGHTHRIPTTAAPINTKSASSSSGTNLHSINTHHQSQRQSSQRPIASSSSSSSQSKVKPSTSSSSKTDTKQQSQKKRQQQQQTVLTKEEEKKLDADTKYILDATKRIIDLADIPPDTDTASLIQRSVRQHVEYEKRLKHHQQHQEGGGGGTKQSDDNNMRKIMDYIQQLTELENRESALNKLSKLRENNPDLAPLLWGTPAVIAALIQEVISVYPYLSGNIEMNSNHSNRCCNALALLQCVASHPETRGLFLKAYIPLFLYPFLNTELNSRPFEYLRLTSLGVIGALVKHPHPNVVPNSFTRIVPDSEVTEFLVKTEAIPLCLHIMEYGNELSQTVATFIIQKILLDDYGLNYICKTSDRFYAISQVLTKMIQDPMKKPSKKLIKHVIRCYLRLCDDNRAYLALHSVLPKYLQSSECEKLIGDDSNCILWLKELRAKYKQSLIAQQEDQAKKAQARLAAAAAAKNASNQHGTTNSNHHHNKSNNTNHNQISQQKSNSTQQQSQQHRVNTHHHSQQQRQQQQAQQQQLQQQRMMMQQQQQHRQMYGTTMGNQYAANTMMQQQQQQQQQRQQQSSGVQGSYGQNNNVYGQQTGGNMQSGHRMNNNANSQRTNYMQR